MQTTVSQPEAITDWLQKEMNYRPLGPHITHSITSIPSPDSIRRVCRGNMIPIFEFLLTRVKSEKTVENIRRNILVHGTGDNAGGGTEGVKGGRDRRVSRGGRKKEKVNLLENNDNREEALQERELAEKEVKRLRCVVRRKRKELNEKMVEVSREEADRKRVVDERANYRFVMLEAYGEQCDVAARIFTQYHKHLCSYVNQVKDSQRADADSSVAVITGLHVSNEKGADYSTIKTLKPVDEEVLETNRERNIRKACELLAEQTIKKIRNSFPAYKGYGIHSNPQVEASKLSIDLNGDIPHEIQRVILDCLKSPPQLLLAVTAYTQRLKLVVAKEIEKTDARADADILRYKYENNRLIDASPDLGSQFPLQLYGNGNNGLDMPSKGTQYQPHVKQFVATEDQLNKAEEARKACQKLLKRLTGSSDVGPPFFSQHVSSLRELELEVWAMEREAAGLKASLTTLTCEVQRLNMLRLERKEVEDSLNKKWKKIEEFDARRLELKSVYNALIKAITVRRIIINIMQLLIIYILYRSSLLELKDTTAFWSQKPLSAMEDASKTIIPACTRVADIANRTKDLIHKEVSAFSCVPDNRLYMLPSTPQALLESLNPNSCTGPEQVSVTEKNADLLTARAGSGDPSAIPSICRVASALQYPAGSEGSEASLASVLESMEFCLKSRGSEASVLEELSKAINFVHTGRDLVESGRSLLDHAYHFQKEYNT
ncbi:putative HAUS augmin-like complex subunit 5 [Helianthus annuus]|nr:putative HAUS augmin-like complex subunit 5 [Helianthus annuus]